MEKTIYLLWRDPAVGLDRWTADVHRAANDTAEAPGVRGVQLNVADESVAPALIRLTTFDRPIEAIVSVWADTAMGSSREATDERLASVSDRLAGYLVTESVPLAPPQGVGSRTDGFANVALLRQPDHLDRVTWLHRWQGDHTPVAIETQGTFGYVQNVVVRPLTPDAPVIDGIVEELFPSAAMTDFHVFFDTGSDDDELSRRMTGMTDSVARFSGEDALLDVVPTSRYVVSSPFHA